MLLLKQNKIERISIRVSFLIMQHLASACFTGLFISEVWQLIAYITNCKSRLTFVTGSCTMNGLWQAIALWMNYDRQLHYEWIVTGSCTMNGLWQAVALSPLWMDCALQRCVDLNLFTFDFFMISLDMCVLLSLCCIASRITGHQWLIQKIVMVGTDDQRGQSIRENIW